MYVSSNIPILNIFIEIKTFSFHLICPILAFSIFCLHIFSLPYSLSLLTKSISHVQDRCYEKKGIIADRAPHSFPSSGFRDRKRTKSALGGWRWM